MSYARFGWEGSDVYVFESTDGFLECCSCRLNGSQRFEARNTAGMLQHLYEHRTAGHTVPEGTFAALVEEAHEINDALRTTQERRGHQRPSAAVAHSG